MYLIAHEHSLTEELLAWGLGLRFLWEFDEHWRSSGVLGLEYLIKYSEGESKEQVKHEVQSHSRYIMRLRPA